MNLGVAEKYATVGKKEVLPPIYSLGDMHKHQKYITQQIVIAERRACKKTGSRLQLIDGHWQKVPFRWEKGGSKWD